MRESLARYSAPVSFVHARSSVDFITTTVGLKVFGTHKQRIIHRRMHKPYKKRVRMPSILDPHRSDIERWLAAEPRLTALAILGRLAEHSPEKFGPPQHTIVQRLLRSLRRNAAEVIIPRMAGGAAPAIIGDPGTGGDAACDGPLRDAPQSLRSCEQ